MAQMYKVFIENTVLFFFEKKDYQLIPGKNIYLPTIEELNSFVLSSLSHLSTVDQFNVVVEDLEDYFKKFIKSFSYVEAAGGIVQQENKLLFIERNGKWDIPKGMIEKEECPEVAAIREIEEECGVAETVIDSKILDTYHFYRYNGTPTIKRTYWYAMNYEGGFETKPQIEEGITKVVWMEKQAISQIEENTYRSILEVLDFFFNK